MVESDKPFLETALELMKKAFRANAVHLSGLISRQTIVMNLLFFCASPEATFVILKCEIHTHKMHFNLGSSTKFLCLPCV